MYSRDVYLNHEHKQPVLPENYVIPIVSEPITFTTFLRTYVHACDCNNPVDWSGTVSLLIDVNLSVCPNWANDVRTINLSWLFV